MQPGALGSHWQDRESPFDRFTPVYDEFDVPPAPIALRAFGSAGKHYMEKFGVSPNLFAEVSVKSRQHAINNPFSLFTSPLSVQEVPNRQGDFR